MTTPEDPRIVQIEKIRALYGGVRFHQVAAHLREGYPPSGYPAEMLISRRGAAKIADILDALGEIVHPGCAHVWAEPDSRGELVCADCGATIYPKAMPRD